MVTAIVSWNVAVTVCARARSSGVSRDGSLDGRAVAARMGAVVARLSCVVRVAVSSLLVTSRTAASVLITART
jgi:hypothetical protein